MQALKFERINTEHVIIAVAVIYIIYRIKNTVSGLSDKYNPLDSDNAVNKAVTNTVKIVGANQEKLKLINPVLAMIYAGKTVAISEWNWLLKQVSPKSSGESGSW